MGLFHSESFKGLFRASLSSQGIRLFAIEKRFDKIPEVSAGWLSPRIIFGYVLGKDAKWSNSKR